MSDTPLPNGTAPAVTSTTSAPAPAAAAAVERGPPPPEIAATLERLSAYRNVRGVMILARASAATSSSGSSGSLGSSGSGIVQSTGAVFEGEGGRRYAGALEAVVNATAGAVAACDEGDELKLMRIRTKRHELIITPDERYLLVVLQDPQ